MRDIAFVSLFFNKNWWEENLVCPAPGFVGAGTGLPLGMGEGSGLGYAVKSNMHSSSEDGDVVSFDKEK